MSLISSVLLYAGIGPAKMMILILPQDISNVAMKFFKTDCDYKTVANTQHFVAVVLKLMDFTANPLGFVSAEIEADLGKT